MAKKSAVGVVPGARFVGEFKVDRFGSEGFGIRAKSDNKKKTQVFKKIKRQPVFA